MVGGYFGRRRTELRLPRKPPVVVGDGEMVKEAQEAAERKAGRPAGEVYASVGKYDPVLRSHCRLDGEG